MRPTWPEQHMAEADLAARMRTCCSRAVGVVFVRDNRVLCTGFNGVPSKYPHPKVCARKVAGLPSGQGYDLCACLHAEMNGIANAAHEGICLKDAEAYCNLLPCWMCMGLMATAGINKVWYAEDYPNPERPLEIAKLAGMEVCKYTGERPIGSFPGAGQTVLPTPFP